MTIKQLIILILFAAALFSLLLASFYTSLQSSAEVYKANHSAAFQELQ